MTFLERVELVHVESIYSVSERRSVTGDIIRICLAGLKMVLDDNSIRTLDLMSPNTRPKGVVVTMIALIQCSPTWEVASSALSPLIDIGWVASVHSTGNGREGK